eukprot:2811354-Rhodomonas_salina.2
MVSGKCFRRVKEVRLGVSAPSVAVCACVCGMRAHLRRDAIERGQLVACQGVVSVRHTSACSGLKRKGKRADATRLWWAGPLRPRWRRWKHAGRRGHSES